MIESRFPKGTKVIAGVSGGADSVALLDELVNAEMQCVVAHCQFHLRGEEAERDARFVQSLAERYHVSFFRIDFQTEAYAQLKGISIEMAARDMRYAWFEELRKREKAEVIAIAHHADDVVETFLMNLSRGTGLRGLTGIKSTETIWRPLLNRTRKEILDYLDERHLTHVEDSTNAECHYTRNKFRNEVIPMMEKVQPKFKQNVLNTIDHLRQAELFLQEQLEEKKSQLMCWEEDVLRLHYSALRQEKNLSFLLYEILSEYGFSPADVDRIEQNVRSPKSGVSFFSAGYRVDVERDSLVMRKRTAESRETTYLIPSETGFTNLPLNIVCREFFDTVAFSRDVCVCYVDAEKIRFPLTLRRWRPGDTFVPFGMKGKKKLSDFFIDQRLSNAQKEQVWILESDGDIVWVIGHRSDNRFRVDSSTKKIMMFRLDNK